MGPLQRFLSISRGATSAALGGSSSLLTGTQRAWCSTAGPAHGSRPQQQQQHNSNRNRNGGSRGNCNSGGGGSGGGGHDRGGRPQHYHRQQQRSGGDRQINRAATSPAGITNTTTTTTTTSSDALPEYTGAAPLPLLRRLMEQKDYTSIEALADEHFDPNRQSLLDFCVYACDARDVVVTLVRAYVALGRMEKVRRTFLAALRDLHPTAADGVEEDDDGRTGTTAIIKKKKPRPSLLNTAIFNVYLEALTRRRNYDREEVVFVLEAMKVRGVPADALTYHFLIELHIRAGYDPRPLWNEAFVDGLLLPLPATVQAVLLRVLPHARDGVFAAQVAREALRCGAAVMDKRALAELIEQWLRDPVTASTTSSPSSSASGVGAPRYPPEMVLWLMLELEVRCVLDKASFVQYIQVQHIVELLLRCAKSADATTAAEALALMDRHVMAKTADVLSLVVWCWAQAGEVERALDLVELMARKGHLELADPLRRHHVECLRYTMDRSFLMELADAVATPALFERALAHLRDRRRRGLVVSIHALDVLVLGAGKLGEGRAALQLALSYPEAWGVQPRTATLNCLLVGCTAAQQQQGSLLMGAMYEAMRGAGVKPSAVTFRVLIRQSVLGDCIDDAVAYLAEVTSHQGLRVEAEMVLPVMERAARVGDVETVNRVSKFSLDCDIGIDGAVLTNIMTHLAEAGQSVEVLRGHKPLHEALRSRSKVGRRRARSELIL